MSTTWRPLTDEEHDREKAKALAELRAARRPGRTPTSIGCFEGSPDVAGRDEEILYGKPPRRPGDPIPDSVRAAWASEDD
jgi:hypothetical protein